LKRVAGSILAVIHRAIVSRRALSGRELFSDDPHDDAWLHLLFEAARLEPAFTISSAALG